MIALGLPKPGKKPAPDGPGASPDDKDDDGGDFDAAANAAFDAYQENDRAGFAAALKAAIMACNSDDYSDDE
jgi:hypothetical protein